VPANEGQRDTLEKVCFPLGYTPLDWRHVVREVDAFFLPSWDARRLLTFEKARGSETSVILGLRLEVGEHCALLGYAASNGSSLPTVRDILWVPSWRVNS